MKLKQFLSNEDYDKSEDHMQSLYKKTDEGYEVQVEGMVSEDLYRSAKEKTNEFRDNNIALTKKFGGVDMDIYNETIENNRKLREAQLIKDKDFDTLFAEKSAVITSDFQAKIDTLTTELADTKNSHSNLISRHEIEGAATTAFTKYKISPDANDAAMALVKGKFSINNGAVVAMKGDTIETGANGNLTVDEFVGSMPEIFKVQSKGGQGRGGVNHGVNSEKSSRDKITSGLGKLLPN